MGKLKRPIVEGKPCFKGHTRFYADGTCVACHRNRARIRSYGEDGVERLKRQGGKCAVCQRGIKIEDDRTHLDHCPLCGKVRAVLCDHCNIIESRAKKYDDFLVVIGGRLAEYIQAHAAACPHHSGVYLNISDLTKISDSAIISPSHTTKEREVQ